MTEDLNWAEDKRGKRMSEMSAHTLRLHISYQTSLAYPCVHQTRRDTSKSFFESVEQLDFLSRFFGGETETRLGRIWTAITMRLWSIISQSQREVSFTWWALAWWNSMEPSCWCGNLNSHFWNGYDMFSTCKYLACIHFTSCCTKWQCFENIFFTFQREYRTSHR